MLSIAKTFVDDWSQENCSKKVNRGLIGAKTF